MNRLTPRMIPDPFDPAIRAHSALMGNSREWYFKRLLPCPFRLPAWRPPHTVEFARVDGALEVREVVAA